MTYLHLGVFDRSGKVLTHFDLPEQTGDATLVTGPGGLTYAVGMAVVYRYG